MLGDKTMFRLTIFILFATLAVGCSKPSEGNEKKTIFVSIAPLKQLVAEVTCGDFPVEVLVPEGMSPEIYDPSARQLTEVSDAQLLFTTGLIDFERRVAERLAKEGNIVPLSKGIKLLAGCCSHHHDGSGHKHGVDPHIWTSPRELKRMVETIHATIKERYPDSLKYDVATEGLISRIEQLDSLCASTIANSGVKSFMIYHPAYTYYAHHYALKQVAVEQEGKEPSPRQLATIVESARSEGTATILIQPQYAIDKVVTLAKECGAEVVVTDPLAEDILSEIERVTEIICRKDE